MIVFLAIPLGLAIGAISGFFGVGGGFLLTPILLLLGYEPSTAITISLLYSMSTSVSGALKHYQQNHILWKTVLLLSISGMLSTQIAKPLVLYLESVGYDELVISLLYVGLLSYFALSMLTEKTTHEKAQGYSISPVRTILIGLTGGFISSVLGVGGGFVMVPLLINVLYLSPRLAIGTSLASIFIIVSTGFFSYIGSVTIPFSLALLLVVGALVGSRIGASITELVSNDVIRKLLGTLYIFTLISVILELFQLPVAGLIVLSIYITPLIIYFIYQYRTKNKRLFSSE
ncbi:sulfite exporter TauE/SafE family protein [Alkalihalobacillus sp. CinArs1]|uniref:sulfite exporter TauE/SafE family protein n=1 Tax=Alkalihalobacillus sp. CinArs1 TaxID=2995314 RepID=UPI0022DD08DE|nr:sulfite exporter TauE/SafE family protein [Alkalihalobacillus sp. CinArs1]